MYSPSLIHRVAHDQHDELVARATAPHRFGADRRSGPQPIALLRRLVGAAMVRAGERVGGPVVASPTAAGTSAFRVVR